MAATMLQDAMAGYLLQLAADVEACQSVEQVDELLRCTAQLLGLLEPCNAEGQKLCLHQANRSETEIGIPSGKLLKLAADCRLAAEATAITASSSETLQKAFYDNGHFTALAELLLHQVAPDWLSCFTHSTRASLLYPFFQKAPPGALLLAVVPALSSPISPHDSDDLRDTASTQRLAQRLLVLCLLEEQPEHRSGLYRLALQCGKSSTKDCAPLLQMNFSDSPTIWTNVWKQDVLQLAAVLASIPDRVEPSAPNVLRAPKFFQEALKHLLQAVTDRWEMCYGVTPQKKVEVVMTLSEGERGSLHGSGGVEKKNSLSAAHEGHGGLQDLAAWETDGTFLLVGEFMIRLCRRGHADVAASELLSALLSHTQQMVQHDSENGKSSMQETRCNEDLRREGVWSALMASMQDKNAVERLGEGLLRNMARKSVPKDAGRSMLTVLYGPLLSTHFIEMRQLFVEHLLLRRVLPRVCLQYILPFLFHDTSEPPRPLPQPATSLWGGSIRGEVVKQLADYWASGDCIRSTPLAQQAYVTAALSLSLKGMTRQQLEATSGLLAALLQGVSGRLESPLLPIRTMAQKVAFTFSTVIDPKNPLTFDEDFRPSEASDEECERVIVEITAGTGKADCERNGAEEQRGKLEVSEDKVKNERRRSRKVNRGRAKQGEKDPDAVVRLSGEGEDGDVEDGSEREGQSSGSGESSDGSDYSLEAYDLADDAEDLEEKVPKQLRDCAAALRKKDDPDAVEKALRAAEELVRARPDELADVAPELASALVHVQSSAVAVEGEEEQLEDVQQKALQALLEEAPGPTLGVLQRAIYSPHVDISQRLFILDVMADGARALASLPSPTLSHVSGSPVPRNRLIVEVSSTSGAKSWLGPGASVGPPGGGPWIEVNSHLPRLWGDESLLSWAHRYERELPLQAGVRRLGRTRRGGRERGTVPTVTNGAGEGGEKERRIVVEPRENRFAGLAAAFMLPLMRDFDKVRQGVDWVGRDFVVLGRLLSFLGTCMEAVALQPQASSLAGALLDMLQARAVASHSEAYVRRAALYAAVQLLRAVPSPSVVGALAGEDSSLARGLEWLREWAFRLSTEDPDDDCCMLASVCLEVHRDTAQRAIQSMAGIPPPSMAAAPKDRRVLITPF